MSRTKKSRGVHKNHKVTTRPQYVSNTQVNAFLNLIEEANTMKNKGNKVLRNERDRIAKEFKESESI